METLTSFNWEQIWIRLASIVTGATAITALFPSTSPAKPALDAVLRFLNVLAGNVARNTNRDTPTE